MTKLVLIVLICGYWWLYFFCGRELHPYWSDELAYYEEAYYFYAYGDWKPPFLRADAGSWIGGFGFHGWGYPLLNGLWLTVFPHSWNPMILSHLLYLTVACLTVLWVCRSVGMSLCVLWLTFSPVLLYVFSFMQESIHCLLAVWTSLLLCRYYQSRHISYLVLFLICVFVGILLRPIWVLWCLGLFPIASTKTAYWKLGILIVMMLLLSFLYLRLFYAPYETGFLYRWLVLVQSSFWPSCQYFASHLWHNLYQLFCYHYWQTHPFYYTYTKGVSIGFLLFCFWRRKKQPIYRAVTYIGFAYVLCLLCFYDMKDWREIRSMLPLYFLCTLVIFLPSFRQRRVLFWSLCILQIALLSFTYPFFKTSLFNKSHIFEKVKVSKPVRIVNTIAFNGSPSICKI